VCPLPRGSDSRFLLLYSDCHRELCSLALTVKTVRSQLVNPNAFHLLTFPPKVFFDAEVEGVDVMGPPNVGWRVEARVECRMIYPRGMYCQEAWAAVAVELWELVT
jgi:hypothetical protein